MLGEGYALALGKIVANLQGLELMIRSFLHDSLDTPDGLHAEPFDFESAVGAELPSDHLTNYDTLGRLIDRYNEANPSSPIDRQIVDLRDALAHGRIFGDLDSNHFRLMKFSQPKNGCVRVTHNEDLTEEWLASRLVMTGQAVNQVAISSEALREQRGLGL